ncbi:protein of unknown function [Taphrina deformans PYCC 5710]|uniref:3'-5' exonuclease domain-containing protein n=1 Tax=Taphrina deformans (strain PYCC 5710 / ATCC 11124 / CBS 356.35 / IMI 108563 / JCM 9778 / NBRC 8474) TaxID=1097556 RepID=R4XND8_TAPDE|nr:protein of unknown function [Taphrina deformans PYCC 5710]|eukprot:CCG84759.1 protein of unknown function [Taphrina deformans PYCC 5710]
MEYTGLVRDFASLHLPDVAPGLDTFQAFPYTLVDSKQTWNIFVDHAKRYCNYARELGINSQFYLDCEGRNLGCHGGELGLLQIGFRARLPAKKARARGCTTHLKVFLLDMISLPGDLLDEFWSTLPCKHITKIVWDGKMDVCELYQGWGITLNRILDLQVVEVLHRTSDRTRPFAVHTLRGLRQQSLQYLTDFQRQQVEAIDGIVKQQHRDQESGLWCRRPVSAVMLEYAALDIYCIAAAHEGFQADGILPKTGKVLDYYEEKSLLYCESFQFTRRIQGDRFNNHGFVPTGIFDDPELLEQEPTITCSGCRRDILERRFHPSNFRKRSGRQYCPICHLIDKKTQTR